MKQIHSIEPIFNKESRVLVLGSFPSVKSREDGFYYAHPQNRFWQVLAAVCGAEIPHSAEDKKLLLLNNHIALWDVVKSCDITGSSDSSINSAEPNDIAEILFECNIEKIFVNGKTAEELYNKLVLPTTLRPAVYLPSTSPANAAWSLEKLIEEWRTIKID